MIKPIVTDKEQLAIVSLPLLWSVGVEAEAKAYADSVIEDLRDTARHYAEKPIGCVGLAANQIGHHIRIVVVWTGACWIPMVNPVITTRDGKQGSSHESCLSRPGVNVKVRRHKRISCAYTNIDWKDVSFKFNNFTARVIQHEVDHLDGIFINN